MMNVCMYVHMVILFRASKSVNRKSNEAVIDIFEGLKSCQRLRSKDWHSNSNFDHHYIIIELLITKRYVVHSGAYICRRPLLQLTF